MSEQEDMGVSAAMREYHAEAKAVGEAVCMWALSGPVAEALSGDGPRISQLLGWPVEIHEEWSWGWQLWVSRETPLSKTQYWHAFEPAQTTGD